jgi:hypothetical protein
MTPAMRKGGGEPPAESSYARLRHHLARSDENQRYAGEHATQGGFVVEFLSSPRGTNEGKTFVGQKSAKAGAGGKTGFAFRPDSTVKPGRTVSATVTSQDGETLEFSPALTVKRSKAG